MEFWFVSLKPSKHGQTENTDVKHIGSLGQKQLFLFDMKSYRRWRLQQETHYSTDSDNVVITAQVCYYCLGFPCAGSCDELISGRFE
ncbi:hypothetical protein BaRGS_00006889 [Batillaria attramentaria]|uniref:Uncharacterized protein n=1 Tax=Batillaria attramentaria TaxID=370345 RepID=A0ABD0LQR3_9CAEN